MSRPLLTIYIPTYNRCNFLASSLKTLVPQLIGLENKVELIVSDNCSTDLTRSVVNNFSELFEIKYVCNNENIGPAKNIVRGWNNLANGEFVWMIGDDDFVRVDAIKKIISEIEENIDIDFFFVNCSTRGNHELLKDGLPRTASDFPELLPAKCSELGDLRLDSWEELLDPRFDCVYLGSLMCGVVRLSLVRGVLQEKDISSKDYSSLTCTYPHAFVYSKTMVGKPAYYIGYPCTITFWGERDWNSRLPLIVVMRLSELIDQYEIAGVSSLNINRMREFQIVQMTHFIPKLLALNNPDREYFDLDYFEKKYRLFPAFLRSLREFSENMISSNINIEIPIFTVLIPAYNHAKFLPDALDSVIGQTIPDWEVIVINDGSTDNTVEVLDLYDKKDARIRVFHKENGGVASALNFGINQSRGKWILWLSADDMFMPNKLEAHLRAIELNPDKLFFHTHYHFLDELTGSETKATHVYKILPERHEQVIKFFEYNYINGISICVEKSLFNEVGGFDEQLKYAQDVDMWLRLCAKTEAVFIDECTCITRLHPGQTTNSFPAACVIDSSIALLKFLNGNTFDKVFPLLDTNLSANIDYIVGKSLAILKNPGNFINSCGFSLLFVRRFNEWIHNKAISKEALINIQDFRKNISLIKLPSIAKESFKNIGSSELDVEVFDLSKDFMIQYANNALAEGLSVIGGVSPDSIISYYDKFLAGSSFVEFPLVSVIMPTYNRPLDILRAVQSVIDQEYSNWELIVINDGGQSPELVSDERIRVLDLGDNYGQASARNVGIKLAKGDIICFLDDDDVYLPNHINIVKEKLKNNDFVYTYAKYVIENNKGVILRTELRYNKIEFSRKRLLVDNFIPINTWGIRRQFLKRNGFFDESMTCLEDWDLLIRLSNNCNFICIPEVTVEVHLRKDSKEGVSARHLNDYYGFYRNIYQKYGFLDSDDVKVAQKKKLESLSIIKNDHTVVVSVDTYIVWQKKHTLVEADGQILAERMHTWNVSPNFLILTVFESTNTALLVDTIDSLNRQFYSQWSLAIVSAMPSPDPLFDEMEMVHWLQVDDDPYQALNQVLANVDVFDWVAVIPPGAVFPENTLSVVSNYINKKPEWCFIYADEDLIDSKGTFIDPLFKPDFNLELLRSTPYIGDACFVRKSVVDEFGGYCGLAGVLNWDLGLKVYEKLGKSFIGHVPEVLLHKPKSVVSDIENKYLVAAEKLTLHRHFERLGVQAAVADGLVEHTYFVEYPVTTQPMVSVVLTVLSIEQLNRLSECIQTIVKNTEYSDYEIVITSKLSESEVSVVIDKLDIGNIKVTHLAYQGNSISPLNNKSLNDLNGDYVLLFNPDLLVLHNYWLETLMAQALRNEVGVVGARIVDKNKQVHHAGIILGMGDFGVADYPNRHLPMSDSGYMNRAVVTQNFSAVSTQCFLVKKALWVDCLETNSNVFDHVDFCLQVIQRGYSIVWTPFVTLMLTQHTLQERTMDQLRQDADQMIKKWLPQLANDPAYNRNLSLKHRHFQIETETDVAWNVDFHDRPRVYAFPANDSGIGEYRVRAPLRALTHAAMIESSLLPNHSATLIPDIVEIERVKPDTLLLQNGTADYLIHAWQQYRKFNDVFMIYSQDDLVHMLPGKHPLQAKWPKDVRRRLSKLMEHSDRLIVATEPLREAYSKYITDIKLVPNYLEKARWLDLKPSKQIRNGRKLRVGWAGGGQHHGDLEFIAPVIEATQDEVDWIFMGMCLDQIRPYVKEYHAGVAFDLYPQKLADLDLDLAIAPLEYNNFNMAKTNLRLLEYGVLGWPVLCSDITPYQGAPVTLVGNNVNHWLKAIHEKIYEPDALLKEGQALQQWVLNNYLLEDHLDEWLAALTP